MSADGRRAYRGGMDQRTNPTSFPSAIPPASKTPRDLRDLAPGDARSADYRANDVLIGSMTDDRSMDDVPDQPMVNEVRAADDFTLRRKTNPMVFVGGGLVLIAAVVGMNFALDSHPVKTHPANLAAASPATTAPATPTATAQGTGTAPSDQVGDAIGSLEKNPPAAGPATMAPAVPTTPGVVAPDVKPAAPAAAPATAHAPRAPQVTRAPLRLSDPVAPVAPLSTPPSTSATPTPAPETVAPSPAPLPAPSTVTPSLTTPQPPAVEQPIRTITDPAPVRDLGRPDMVQPPSPPPALSPNQVPAPPALSPNQVPTQPGQ